MCILETTNHIYYMSIGINNMDSVYNKQSNQVSKQPMKASQYEKSLTSKVPGTDVVRIKKLLNSIDPLKGKGIEVLATYLNQTYILEDYIKSAQLAADLIALESLEVIETLITLLNDGFEGNLGSLLYTARKL